MMKLTADSMPSLASGGASHGPGVMDQLLTLISEWLYHLQILNTQDPEATPAVVNFEHLEALKMLQNEKQPNQEPMKNTLILRPGSAVAGNTKHVNIWRSDFKFVQGHEASRQESSGKNRTKTSANWKKMLFHQEATIKG